MSGRLAGRTILTTGSAHKGSTQLLRALTPEGPNIAICAEFHLKARAAKITGMGAPAIALPVRWDDPDGIDAAVRHVISIFGRIDAVIHIAPAHLGFVPGRDAVLEAVAAAEDGHSPLAIYYWEAEQEAAPPPDALFAFVLIDPTDARSCALAAERAVALCLENLVAGSLP